jgi:site-specific recombinase XerD
MRYLFEYVNHRGKKDTPRTINNRISVVRLFLEFLYKEDYLAQALWEGLVYIKALKRLPQVVLTNSEVKKLIKSCPTDSIV